MDSSPPYAAMALGITSQDWVQLGVGNDPMTEATGDLETIAERMTALLLVRIVAICACRASKNNSSNEQQQKQKLSLLYGDDLSTTAICRTALLRGDHAWKIMPPPTDNSNNNSDIAATTAAASSEGTVIASSSKGIPKRKNNQDNGNNKNSGRQQNKKTDDDAKNNNNNGQQSQSDNKPATNNDYHDDDSSDDDDEDNDNDVDDCGSTTDGTAATTGNNEFICEKTIQQLKKFVNSIIRRYRDVPYHNREHAYHVTISINKLLDLMLNRENNIYNSSNYNNNAKRKKLPPMYGLRSDPLMHLCLIFSAVIHDVEHKGIGNRQLSMESDPLAILYNDKSIAENRSLYVAFTELLKDGYKELRTAIFGTPNVGDEYFRFRRVCIDLVLSTDIASPEQSQQSKERWSETFGEKAQQFHDDDDLTVDHEEDNSNNNINNCNSDDVDNNNYDDDDNEYEQRCRKYHLNEKHQQKQSFTRRMHGSIISEVTLDVVEDTTENDETDTDHTEYTDHGDVAYHDEGNNKNNYNENIFDEESMELEMLNTKLHEMTNTKKKQTIKPLSSPHNHKLKYRQQQLPNIKRVLQRTPSGRFLHGGRRIIERTNSMKDFFISTGTEDFTDGNISNINNKETDTKGKKNDASESNISGDNDDDDGCDEFGYSNQLKSFQLNRRSSEKGSTNVATGTGRVLPRNLSANSSTTATGGVASMSRNHRGRRMSITRTIDLSGQMVQTYARMSTRHSAGGTISRNGSIASRTSSISNSNHGSSRKNRQRSNPLPLRSSGLSTNTETTHQIKNRWNNTVNNNDSNRNKYSHRSSSVGIPINEADNNYDNEDDVDNDPLDELKQLVVMEQLLLASDVAHNLQGWEQMVKWSTRLFFELKKAYILKRSTYDPKVRWYEGQIGFLEAYLLPLSKRMEDMQCFGDLIGPVFGRIIISNRDQWTTHGRVVSEEAIIQSNEYFAYGSVTKTMAEF